jgi:hypothetical protein
VGRRRNSIVTNAGLIQHKARTPLVYKYTPGPTTTLATAGAIRFPAAKRQRRSISDFPNFSLTPKPNHLHIPRRPAPLRGALRNVTNVGRDAVDAGGALDGRCWLRTAKSCGPDAPTLASSWRKKFRQTDAGYRLRRPPERPRRMLRQKACHGSTKRSPLGCDVVRFDVLCALNKLLN